MSPEKRMPPSAITGMSCARGGARALHDRGDHRHADAGDDARRADRAGADADLDRVDAERRSAPRSPSAVATLPATRSTSGKRRRSVRDHVEHALRVAVRGVDDQHVDVARRPAPRRAPSCRARCRPRRRSAAGRASPSTRSGYLTAFWMSLTVISPFSRKSWSTTSSFSTLCWCRISRAASSVVPTGTVISVLAASSRRRSGG